MEIKLNNISKEFDGNIVLKDVNMQLKTGNIYGLIGRNGSGKSVLLKILCGFYNATTGTITLDNNIINKDEFLPNARVLIEKPTFLPDISGLENLKLLANIKNIIDEKRINETLDLVNLSETERNKKYHTYSLGMKQKLGIAQVIMENPDIMIFDEPFNGIEEDTVKKLRKYLLEQKQNKIIIISTHIKEDIDGFVDVLYKIDNQQVIQL